MWGFHLFGKNEQLLSSVFQDVFNSAREYLGKRAKYRTCDLVDVFGASLVLLNRVKINIGQFTQLPLRQLVVLSPDLQAGRQRFFEVSGGVLM